MKSKIQYIHEKYLKNYHERTMIITFISFSINLLIGIGKLFLGIFYSSSWFIITAGYYITLSLARGQILHETSKINKISEVNKKYKNQFLVYHRSGYFIIFLGLSYIVLCIWMFFFDERTTYPEYILYGVVSIAFYKIGTAIYKLFTVKKHNNPLLSVIKFISFLDACVSIVAVQCALLTMKQSSYASSSSALLGMAVAILFLTIGIFIIHKK